MIYPVPAGYCRAAFERVDFPKKWVPHTMIAHLTDIHIGNAGAVPRGVAVRDNFLAVLKDISAIEPDTLVLTGDLSLDVGDREIYRWVHRTLEETGIDYHVLPGNHDDPEMVAEVFGHRAGELNDRRERCHRAVEAAGEQLLLFDVPGGEVVEEDLQWLRKAVTESPREEVLLFMHYPPVPLPVIHMERYYALARRDDVRRILAESSRRVYLFCGHYHNELTQEREGCSVFLTPSTYFQIDPLEEAFAVEHHLPGWRFIQRFDGRITTGVRYRGL